MKVIRSTEPIQIAHPPVLLFSPPGIGKTSMAYTARKPLNFDFDKGAHRSGNRKDTAHADSWEEVDAMLTSPILNDYSTIILDTVGRCLDLMVLDIIDKNPKRASGGQLDQKGWGMLRDRFHTFLARLRALDKDVVMLAHAREKDDGDALIMRPDIQGGSYGEVMKSADLVGYLYVQGKDRILDFNPTDKWVGKNPAQWTPFRVPDYSKSPEFLAGLLDKAREALGRISQESAEVATILADWRAAVETFTTVDEMNGALTKIEPLAPIIRAQVKAILWEAVKAAGMQFDPKSKSFIEAKKAEAPKPAAVEG